MDLKIVNLKQEFFFFFKAFWTNGFSIWTIVLVMAETFDHVPIVCEFRESLWFDQLMWIFFVPLIYQISFRFFLYPKLTPQLRTSNNRLKIIFVSFVLGIIISSVIIEYVYFAAEVLFIIPQHHKEARGSNYEIIPWLKTINWAFIIIFLTADRYREHLIKMGDVVKRENPNLNTGHQISLLSVGFSLSLSTFVILYSIMGFEGNQYCQTLI